jgi:hypothetical protein
MANEDKYPKNIGATIPVTEAKNEMASWQAANPDLPASFRIAPSLIAKALNNRYIHGIRFCNGFDESYNYAPVMAGITKDGVPMICIDTNGTISYDAYKANRQRWADTYPKGTNYFYLGIDELEKLANGGFKSVLAGFTIDSKGENNAVLISSNSFKVSSTSDDNSTSLNGSWLCPPICQNGE